MVSDPFRVRAYEEAKRALQASEVDIGDIAQNKTKVKGVGKHIQELIREYLATGNIGLLGRLTQKYPVSLLELGKIPGLGIKKIKSALRCAQGFNARGASVCNRGKQAACPRRLWPKNPGDSA